mmetsp:Transcript_5137/g.19889  ORF Transcript_5137/g.19889 Transcript_5137/m.19889 type:complete len:274 (-) Transcript_5137:149-970(-)
MTSRSTAVRSSADMMFACSFLSNFASSSWRRSERISLLNTFFSFRDVTSKSENFSSAAAAVARASFKHSLVASSSSLRDRISSFVAFSASTAVAAAASLSSIARRRGSYGLASLSGDDRMALGFVTISGVSASILRTDVDSGVIAISPPSALASTAAASASARRSARSHAPNRTNRPKASLFAHASFASNPHNQLSNRRLRASTLPSSAFTRRNRSRGGASGAAPRPHSSSKSSFSATNSRYRRRVTRSTRAASRPRAFAPSPRSPWSAHATS